MMTNLKRTVVMVLTVLAGMGILVWAPVNFPSCSQGLTGIKKITEIGETQLHVFNLTFEAFLDITAS